MVRGKGGAIMTLPVVYSSLKEAGDNILQLISRMIQVNTFCISNIDESNSYFLSVLNRGEKLAEQGGKISVYEAY